VFVATMSFMAFIFSARNAFYLQKYRVICAGNRQQCIILMHRRNFHIRRTTWPYANFVLPSVQSTGKVGKCCSICHWNFPETQIRLFGRMESAQYFPVVCTNKAKQMAAGLWLSETALRAF
ncbi:hypothetical protein ACROYT_G036582, partial [Oculina patagonica]